MPLFLLFHRNFPLDLSGWTFPESHRSECPAALFLDITFLDVRLLILLIGWRRFGSGSIGILNIGFFEAFKLILGRTLLTIHFLALCMCCRFEAIADYGQPSLLALVYKLICFFVRRRGIITLLLNGDRVNEAGLLPYLDIVIEHVHFIELKFIFNWLNVGFIININLVVIFTNLFLSLRPLVIDIQLSLIFLLNKFI